MATIRELDALTIGQIAAGEIIERPVSVVKELVENAIDANAARIDVYIDRGGMDRIEVIDDGEGMQPEDLPLAVRRHATSKLRAAIELESIGTLGFRGEGLASIAAVARLEILSRTADAPIAARMAAHADAFENVQAEAGPVGTRVTARDLFANLPVRREFLASASAEFNRVSGWLSSFALAYPSVTFALRHDGRDVWVMPATDDARERLRMVFGSHANDLIALHNSPGPAFGGRLRGFISAPGHDRPDRRMQLLFVNGRLLRSGLLAGAWNAGYATYAMTGRHPYGVLFLELEAHHVDPNVHPTKSDVRLRYANQIFEVARTAIAATLGEHARRRLAQSTSVETMPGLSLGPPARELRVLAQLDRTFILASDSTSLVLVDQHAAHERIAYESILAGARDGMRSEPLLLPQIIELDQSRSAAVDRLIEPLREAGLEIEPFGERTYRLIATPSGYGARRFNLADFIDELNEEPKRRDVRERVWASLACHSVTVAGEQLTEAEMSTLLERLGGCQNPMHCPHGRPTLIALGSEEIARMFKRA